jgi:hypothetical protein
MVWLVGNLPQRQSKVALLWKCGDEGCSQFALVFNSIKKCRKCSHLIVLMLPPS